MHVFEPILDFCCITSVYLNIYLCKGLYDNGKLHFHRRIEYIRCYLKVLSNQHAMLKRAGLKMNHAVFQNL